MSDAPVTLSWLAARTPPPPQVLFDRLQARVRDAPSGNGGGAADPLPGPPSGAQHGAELAGPAPSEIGPVARLLAWHAVGLLADLCREPAGPGTKSLATTDADTRGRLRERAYRLLEADALLTYALEAAAEEGPDAVRALASWVSASRLASLLAEADAA
ncbi:MAG TPA: hypothetical protein VK837_12615 [Longimicrobiales bacterium]|nr:hypothetical protein [Longimicrobiales bacterium]